MGPKGEAGILWMAGRRLSMGCGCCKAVLNRKSIPIFPPHCPEISFPRCVCSLLICFPGLMLPFCSLPLTEGYNSVRCLPSPPQSVGSSVILVPTAGRAGGAWPLLVAGWLPAEKFYHAGCGGLESQPSPAMPPVSRAPPPVWPLVDGGLTSWGPLAGGRQSLRGSEARERACTAALWPGVTACPRREPCQATPVPAPTGPQGPCP